MSQGSDAGSRARRILSAYGTSLLGVVSGLLTNLWLIRKVTQSVTPDEFGVYAFALQVISYLGVVQLGLDFAGSRRIAEALGQRDAAGANAAYWEVGRFSRRAAAVASVLVLAIAGVLGQGAWGDPMHARLGATTALLAGAALLVGFATRRYSAALIGSHRQSLVNLVTVGNSFLVTALAYPLLRAGLGVVCIPAASLLSATVSYFVYRMLVSRWCLWATRSAAPSDRALFKSMLTFGGMATVGSIAWTVEATSDVVILGFARGSADVAVYVLWWRFPSMIFDFCTRLVTSAFPTFAERHGTSREHAEKLLAKLGQITMGLATLAMVGVGLWLPSFVGLWLGDQYTLSDARAVAFGMAAVVAIRTVGNLLGMYWMARGEARLPAAVSWAQALTKVSLACLLVWPLGILGVLIASSVAAALQVIVFGIALHSRGALAGRLLVNAGVLTSIALTVEAVGYQSAATTSLPRFAVGTVATVVAWAALWVGLAWNSDLRPNLTRALRMDRRG